MFQSSREILEERRACSRVLLSLPVAVYGHSGITRDMCSKGLYFEIDESEMPDATVELSVDLLPVRNGLLRVICRAQVVRREQRDGKLGLAATIESYCIVVVEAPPEHVVN